MRNDVYLPWPERWLFNQLDEPDTDLWWYTPAEFSACLVTVNGLTPEVVYRAIGAYIARLGPALALLENLLGGQYYTTGERNARVSRDSLDLARSASKAFDSWVSAKYSSPQKMDSGRSDYEAAKRSSQASERRSQGI